MLQVSKVYESSNVVLGDHRRKQLMLLGYMNMYYLKGKQEGLNHNPSTFPGLKDTG